MEWFDPQSCSSGTDSNLFHPGNNSGSALVFPFRNIHLEVLNAMLEFAVMMTLDVAPG